MFGNEALMQHHRADTVSSKLVSVMEHLAAKETNIYLIVKKEK